MSEQVSDDMSETTARRHGLERFLSSAESAAEARVDIGIMSRRGFLNIRLDPRNGAAAEAAGRVLGQPLPLASNRFTGGEHRVYWLGPDEWLIETGAKRAVKLVGELAVALTDCHATVNDVSGGHIALRVTGADVRAVLAKGCALDLHPRKFGPGQCARTGLGKANVLLAVDDDAASCTILVARSYAGYLCRWLAHAARPHGVQFSMLQQI
ncbi:MAG: sarcosine oxidase subunit gamma [Proteobacteria bacterium]|nr:sarcosine oxidase subunit gamma [Pseudomonadota bacterium]MYJ94384.1 sarcosine oxidase subunit gamma [Pseudomonadota bacterium]